MFRRAKRGLVPGSLPPVPERMCVACRGRADQASLARFVVVDGAFRWDAARRHPGRGAYLHPACLGDARAGRALQRALGGAGSPGQLAPALAAAAASCAPGEPA